MIFKFKEGSKIILFAIGRYDTHMFKNEHLVTKTLTKYNVRVSPLFSLRMHGDSLKIHEQLKYENVKKKHYFTSLMCLSLVRNYQNVDYFFPGIFTPKRGIIDLNQFSV